jgi:hypothetical protein
MKSTAIEHYDFSAGHAPSSYAHINTQNSQIVGSDWAGRKFATFATLGFIVDPRSPLSRADIWESEPVQRRISLNSVTPRIQHVL